MQLFYGSHISISQGIHNCFKNMYKLDKKSSCFQIFVNNPQSLKNSKLDKYSDDEIKKILSEKKLYKMKLFIHSPFVINLARKYNTTTKTSSALKLLISELSFCEKIGGEGVVVHFGNFLDMSREIALKNMLTNIKFILSKISKTKLILETSSGMGTELCSDLVEFSEFYSKFTTSEKKKLGFCVDTCHIFSAGYDISSDKAIDRFLSLFDKLLGIKNISLIHLNNSKNELGAKIDRHQNLLYGKIPKSSFEYFIKKIEKYKIPLVLETPALHQTSDLRFLHNLNK